MPRSLRRVLCFFGLHSYRKRPSGYFYRCEGCWRLKGWWEMH